MMLHDIVQIQNNESALRVNICGEGRNFIANYDVSTDT